MVHFESQTSPNESQSHLPDSHSKTFCSFFFFWLPVLEIQLGEFCWIVSYLHSLVHKNLCRLKCAKAHLTAVFWEDTSIGRDRRQCRSQTLLARMPAACEQQHTLPFHAHAGKCLSAAPYTIIHLEHSQRLRVSSLADFSLSQWELPLCLLSTAGGRKRKPKSSATK